MYMYISKIIITISLTQSHLLLYNHTQTEKLCAAHWREEQKNTNIWRPLASQSEHSVYTLGVDTFGGWGLESRAVFATLVDRISGRSVINQLYQ